MSTVVVKSVDEAHVRRCVDEYALRLFSSRPEVEEIVVFGSFARGDYAPGSDIDLFIVLTKSDKSLWNRIPEYLPGAFPVGVDLFPYTREEMAARASSPLLEEVRRSPWRYRRPPIGHDSVTGALSR